jgi:hypothetical protein
MSDFRERSGGGQRTMCRVIDSCDRIIDRFVRSSHGFEEALRAVRPNQWTWPTPCTEWNVRRLVNHVVRGNLNYLRLVEGGTRAEFLELRDVDALGSDPIGGYDNPPVLRGSSGRADGRVIVAGPVASPHGQKSGQQGFLISLDSAEARTMSVGLFADGRFSR